MNDRSQPEVRPMRQGLVIGIFARIFEGSLNGSALEGVDTAEGLTALFRKFAEQSKEQRGELSNDDLRTYVQDFLTIREQVPDLIEGVYESKGLDGAEIAFATLCEKRLRPSLSKDWAHWFFRRVHEALTKASKPSP